MIKNLSADSWIGGSEDLEKSEFQIQFSIDDISKTFKTNL